MRDESTFECPVELKEYRLSQASLSISPDDWFYLYSNDAINKIEQNKFTHDPLGRFELSLQRIIKIASLSAEQQQIVYDFIVDNDGCVSTKGKIKREYLERLNLTKSNQIVKVDQTTEALELNYMERGLRCMTDEKNYEAAVNCFMQVVYLNHKRYLEERSTLLACFQKLENQVLAIKTIKLVMHDHKVGFKQEISKQAVLNIIQAYDASKGFWRKLFSFLGLRFGRSQTMNDLLSICDTAEEKIHIDEVLSVLVARTLRQDSLTRPSGVECPLSLFMRNKLSENEKLRCSDEAVMSLSEEFEINQQKPSAQCL